MGSNRSGLGVLAVLGVVLVAVASVGLYLVLMPRVNLPDHVLGHRALVVPDLLSPEIVESLMAEAKKMKEFPTNTAAHKFYKMAHEHIGEAQPLEADGTCQHKYLLPSKNKSECILPGRIDIGRHYILSGGVQGLKESREELVGRLLSFGRYLFDLEEYPVVQRLFASDQFQSAAKQVCPPNKQVLDPFQFNFIVQVPGQTVALHVDAVYFWGATRFQFPQWLLAVMKFSGLFEDRFIDQIQVVGYFHNWTATEERGGEFVYWSDNAKEPIKVKPESRAGSIVDGSKIIHAATVYRKHTKAPMLDKDNDNVLKYVGNDNWDLRSNGALVQTYKTDDLRWTIVYRARCFESQERVEQFYHMLENGTGLMDMEKDILDVLKLDLVKKGKFSDKAAADAVGRLDLALVLLDQYIRYPLSPYAVIPYNYCAIYSGLPFCS